jgi:5'-nucleotidase
MRILLTNDDGYAAAGLRLLHDVLAREHDVIVSAPEREQSGVGHAFTYNTPLKYRPIPADVGMNGYIVSGTPSDSVKFAMGHLLKQKPDVVVSGMNIGENSGVSSIYSGTVAAAREGAFWQVLSMAFSLCVEGRDHAAHYAPVAAGLLTGIASLSRNGMGNEKNRIFFNVNFPGCNPSEAKGIRVTRQSLAFFDDRYRHDQAEGREDHFWIYGEKQDVEQADDYDSRALMNRYITITPMHFDSTADTALRHLKKLERGLI